MNIRHLPYQIDEDKNRFHFFETLWKQRGLSLLLQYCSADNKTLLDYGCGRGEMLALCSKAGFRVKGTDLDPKCVEIASKHGSTCILDADRPLQQFGAKSFDVVTCFHVLEHVDNPRRVLSQLADIARLYVVVAVPNLRYLHQLFQRRISLDSVNKGHLQSWDHWHLLNLAETHCGLKLVSWSTDATILPLLSRISLILFGRKVTLFLETGIFRKFFPFHGVSVLGLFRPVALPQVAS
jgi:SAM-dependent methyltransferase